MPGFGSPFLGLENGSEARPGSAQGHVRLRLAVLGLPPLIYGPVRLKKCGENFNKTG
jgi:hypothetical protein